MPLVVVDNCKTTVVIKAVLPKYYNVMVIMSVDNIRKYTLPYTYLFAISGQLFDLATSHFA